MSKLYRIDMNITTEKFTPNGGFLMYTVEKTVDPRGFKERTGKEVFAYLAGAALSGAHQRVSYAELKQLRKVTQSVSEAAAADGKWVCNKTDLDSVKGSIRDNKNWINSEEMMLVLDAVMERIDTAEIVE